MNTKWMWLCMMLAACGKDGSGRAGSETRTPSSFNSVEVDGVVNVDMTLGGSAYSVEVSGDDNLVPLVETKVVGDKLIIRTSESVDPELKLLVRVSAPDVREVEASGVSHVTVAGVSNEALRLELSGAGSMEAKGKTKTLSLEVSGAGSIDADELGADKVDVEVSGAGNVDVAEPKELNCRISGAGHVGYGGSPEIHQDISGAGKLVKR